MVFFLPFVILEAEPRPSYVPGMHSTTKPHPYSKVSPIKGLNPTEQLPEIRHTTLFKGKLAISSHLPTLPDLEKQFDSFSWRGERTPGLISDVCLVMAIFEVEIAIQ